MDKICFFTGHRRLSRDKDYVRRLLESAVLDAINDGVDTFIEAGPGKTLSGFVRKISRDAAVYNVEDVQSVKKLEEGLC